MTSPIKIKNLNVKKKKMINVELTDTSTDTLLGCVHTSHVCFNSNKLDCLVSALHLNRCKSCYANPGVHQTSGPRPLKRWVSVRFQTNSGVVRIKYERNTNQILLNEPKTGCNDKMWWRGSSGVAKTKWAEGKRGATRSQSAFYDLFVSSQVVKNKSYVHATISALSSRHGIRCIRF